MTTAKDFAFPSNTESWAEGMTMRQWYKGQALIKILDMEFHQEAFNKKDKELTMPQFIAKRCGQLADAMIAEDSAHAKGNVA